MTVQLETAPGVWTEYTSARAAAAAHGIRYQTVLQYLDRHDGGQRFYARRKFYGKGERKG